MLISLRPSSSLPATPLADSLRSALASGDETRLEVVTAVEPESRRDALLALALVHDLFTAPLASVGAAARFEHHPAIAQLKTRLESEFLSALSQPAAGRQVGEAAVEMMQRIAAHDLVPPVYDWLADEASLDEMRSYLALEGGPDGGFDDLVALCQVGLEGEPKLELAQNYWDEMGRGTPSEVHTELQRRMARALGIEAVPREQQPVEALERPLLGTTLATNRWMQPELIGALGLIELQAGPRCRRVVKGLERVGVPADAVPFYAEHAVADPRHGKDWLVHVVAPLARDVPEWGPRIVAGARWRAEVNARFFGAALRWFAPERAGRENPLAEPVRHSA
ncbi:MAG TPA: iron-containing redox enzyme family protein [Mycobacteriales bacterium]|nr:iron-containing redox enzyme family protein [Mycobacteriales bacterium]